MTQDHPSKLKYQLRRSVEALLWASGCLCLAVVGVHLSVRHVSAQMAVAQFVQTSEAETQSRLPALSEAPDQSHWSPRRVAEYARSDRAGDSRAVRALLRIPRLGLEAPVFEGTDNWVLNRGLGRVAGTAPIGMPGNLAIAGHRDSFFRALKDITKQDEIEVRGIDSTTRYRVTDTWIVEPDAISVLQPTEKNSITLVTCYPFYYVGDAPQRFIVRATAVD